MVWTLCTSGQAVNKAGLNANSAIIINGQALASWSDEAEAEVSSIARSDVVTNFGSLTANGKQILKQFVTSHIAESIINYDMSGFTSRQEALTMLNVQENNKDSAASLIREDKNKKYLGIT